MARAVQRTPEDDLLLDQWDALDAITARMSARLTSTGGEDDEPAAAVLGAPAAPAEAELAARLQAAEAQRDGLHELLDDARREQTKARAATAEARKLRSEVRKVRRAAEEAEERLRAAFEAKIAELEDACDTADAEVERLRTAAEAALADAEAAELARAHAEEERALLVGHHQRLMEEGETLRAAHAELAAQRDAMAAERDAAVAAQLTAEERHLRLEEWRRRPWWRRLSRPRD